MSISYNLAQRVLIYNDGTVCEITNLIDASGEETDNPDDAVMVVCKMANDQWLTIRVNEDTDVPIEHTA